MHKSQVYEYKLMNICTSIIRESFKWSLDHQWPLLLTWFNFNPSMDK